MQTQASITTLAIIKQKFYSNTMEQKKNEEKNEIEEHAKELEFTQEEISFIQNGAVVSVAFSSGFTAVTTFFTSIIISQYKSFNPSINIPTLFLIISTFGFLYATLAYSNVTGLLLKGRRRRSKKCGIIGNVLSEYLGVYFLILAIPLVINVVSSDAFLRSATTLIDLGGLFVYHVSGISIMERNYQRFHLLFLFIIIFLELGLIIFQFTNILFFEVFAFLLITFIFLLANSARREKI